MRPTIIRVTGESENVSPRNGTDFSLEEAQGIVGGYVEVVNLSKTQIMIVNEEGAVNGMEYNEGATLAYAMALGRTNPIFGDVLVCETKMFR